MVKAQLVQPTVTIAIAPLSILTTWMVGLIWPAAFVSLFTTFYQFWILIAFAALGCWTLLKLDQPLDFKIFVLAIYVPATIGLTVALALMAACVMGSCL